METHYSIAIDGPAGAGKSTIAKRLAEELGYRYVDTGAIYRTVGYFYDLVGIGPKDVDGIHRLINEFVIEVVYDEADGSQHMLLNELDVTGDIRTPEISQIASQIAANPEVRALLLDMQRDVAKKYNVVMDGRDIGTVVLPKADVKIFLTASVEVRAQRRYEELQRKGAKDRYEKVLKDLEQRDYQDSHRATAPLKRAKDAVLVDSSQLDIDGVVAAIRQIVAEKLDV